MARLVPFDEAIDINETANTKVHFAIELVLDDLHHNELVAEQVRASSLSQLLQVKRDPVNVKCTNTLRIVASSHLNRSLFK